MLFSSLEFILFFPAVLAVFFLLPFRFRWVWLLFASYYFYAAWKPEYLILIILTTAVGYLSAMVIGHSKSTKTRKLSLALGVLCSLSPLFFFKYFNFAAENINHIFDWMKFSYQAPAFDLILPVGISFYTFQVLSYIIDVYQCKRGLEKNPGIFALYVSFFPQLVAGPIERSTTLLPQFRKHIPFIPENIIGGSKLLLWGLFKKLVIADNLAPMVDAVYANPYDHTGITLIIASVAFAFQIFCDFSAYSDMAVGTAKMLNIKLLQNFNRPYSATNIKDFWSRWHISLSTWFRDYVYIPLGGNRVALPRFYVNLFITFLVSGLWHGASWTFVVWGAIHGLLLIIEHTFKAPLQVFYHITGLAKSPKLLTLVKLFTTFTCVTLAWVFFRAQNIQEAVYIIQYMPHGLIEQLSSTAAIMESIQPFGFNGMQVLALMVGIPMLFFTHHSQAKHGMQTLYVGLPTSIRWLLYYILIFSVLLLGPVSSEDFIYFQF